MRLADAMRSNAVDLAHVPPAKYDAALLLGPLYHLIEEADRQRAVAESARVLRPGGLVFAAVITRYAAIRWAAKNDPALVVEDPEGFERIVASGVNLARPGGGFTNAHFMHAADLRPLMEQAGFETLDLIACEGVVSLIEERVNALDGDLGQVWVDLNYRLGKDPAVHAGAEHVLYVGRKP